MPLGVNPRLCLRCLLEDKGDPQVGNHSQTRRAARTAGHSLPGLGLSPARRGLGRAHLAVLHAGAGAALRPLRTSLPVPGCEGHRAWTACCGLTGQRPRAGSPGGSESSRAVFWSASLRAPRSLCWSAVLPGGSVERELHKAGREKGDCFQIRPAPTPTPEALRGFQEGHNSFTAYHGPSKVHALRLTWPPALEQVRSRVSPGPSFISPTVMAP